MQPRESNAVDRARQLARDFAARASDHDRHATFPFENFEALKGAGLLALTVPTELGGDGSGLKQTCDVLGAIARGDASTALVLAMQYLMHATIVRSPRWPLHIREKLAREAVNDGALINALRVEPELGTPARGGMPATTAEETSGGWRISGHKIYTTGAPLLSWLMVWGKTAEAEPRVGTFLVPARANGVRIVETWDHMGMRASGSHDVIFEGAAIPRDYAVDIRKPSEWAERDDVQAAWYVLGISALYNGVAAGARDWLVRYLTERVPASLGAPLSTLPRFQEAVGEIDARLLTNRVLIENAAIMTDRGDPPSAAESGLVKMTVTTNAIAAVERAIELIGNPGLSRTNELERHLRDVLCSRIHTPQNDTILIAAGRAAFKAIERKGETL
ncbi:MAG TPA: acyl-CoA dehydrogenase family protein [Candidatus Binataceae bacterium]|nr:acyl-CoA dehydrogenase family protein [Candidatus Binataceae bacterium]